MQRLFRASTTIALAAALAFPAIAAELPGVKVSSTNAVPACATPGRLMAYLQSRNSKLNPRFESVATEYMRNGEALGVRWDMAFFQMVLETAALSYTGDVRADQNNFAGLGAAGGGNHGERFADIPSGVKAHLQHLLMYAGDHIDNPVAERTRKVQEWGVLTEWQRTIKGPMTFAILARQWAPGSRGYGRDIATISDDFYDNFCNRADPHPEMVQEARGGRSAPATQVATADALSPAPKASKTDTPAKSAKAAKADKTAKADAKGKSKTAASPAAPAVIKPAAQLAAAAIAGGEGAAQATDPATDQAGLEVAAKEPDASDKAGAKVSGADIAARAIAEERNEAPPRAGLGAAGMFGAGAAQASAAASEPAPEQRAASVPPLTILNGAAPEQPGSGPSKSEPSKGGALAAGPQKPTAKKETDKGAALQTAAITGAATQLKVATPDKGAGKCKVWTASYGGQRAILIKAATGEAVNYTVLDVNEATEQREVEAYISAYAKGGQSIGSFNNQTKALDKAFELCPEG